VGRPFKIRPLHCGLATVESATQHQLTVEEQQSLGAPIAVVPQFAPDVRPIGFPYEFEEKLTFTNHSFPIYVAPEKILYKRANIERTAFGRRLQFASENGTEAIALSHEIARAPPPGVMSMKAQVSCSTECDSVSSFIGARTTSLSGV
jgi:hypothetical protein